MRAAGDIVRERREKLGIPQKLLAERCGISAKRLHDLELCRRQCRPDEWKSIAKVLDLNPRRFTDPPPFRKARRNWRVRPPSLKRRSERSINARIWAAKRENPDLVHILLKRLEARGDSHFTHRFLREACLESGTEFLFWLQLLALGGATTTWQSPLRCGFRSRFIVDPGSEKYIGDLRFPCLEAKLAGVHSLHFPQVSVQTRKGLFRLDSLVKIMAKKSSLWVDLEIDGRGHNARFDFDREQALRLTTVRVCEQDLLREDFLEELGAKLGSLLCVQMAESSDKA